MTNINGTMFTDIVERRTANSRNSGCHHNHNVRHGRVAFGYTYTRTVIVQENKEPEKSTFEKVMDGIAIGSTIAGEGLKTTAEVMKLINETAPAKSTSSSSKSTANEASAPTSVNKDNTTYSVPTTTIDKDIVKSTSKDLANTIKENVKNFDITNDESVRTLQEAVRSAQSQRNDYQSIIDTNTANYNAHKSTVEGLKTKADQDKSIADESADKCEEAKSNFNYQNGLFQKLCNGNKSKLANLDKKIADLQNNPPEDMTEAQIKEKIEGYEADKKKIQENEDAERTKLEQGAEKAYKEAQEKANKDAETAQKSYDAWNLENEDLKTEKSTKIDKENKTLSSAVKDLDKQIKEGQTKLGSKRV